MGKHRNYTMFEKIEALDKAFSEGKGMHTIGKEMGISPSVIYRWVKKYEKGGLEELKMEYRGISNKGRTIVNKYNKTSIN